MAYYPTRFGILDAGTGSLSNATFDHATPQATDHSTVPSIHSTPRSLLYRREELTRAY